MLSRSWAFKEALEQVGFACVRRFDAGRNSAVGVFWMLAFAGITATGLAEFR
jgi:hypothetical protein